MNLKVNEIINVVGRGLIATLSMKENNLTQATIPAKNTVVSINGGAYRVIGYEYLSYGFGKIADSIGLNVTKL